VLAKFGARPHWGKHFTMDPKQFLKRSYPRLDDFRKLAEKLDPKRKFVNKFLNDNVFV
uniref:ALO domain-containing protein n=1 Tax=Globodera pallida TaxID=36090 RepID=A0A183CNT5_GLOPA